MCKIEKVGFKCVNLQNFCIQWCGYSSGFLLVGQKSYFSGMFKLEPIKNSHIWFVVKVLRKYCNSWDINM